MTKSKAHESKSHAHAHAPHKASTSIPEELETTDYEPEADDTAIDAAFARAPEPIEGEPAAPVVAEVLAAVVAPITTPTPAALAVPSTTPAPAALLQAWGAGRSRPRAR